MHKKENWIDIVVASTRHAESPARYYYWSMLAVISAVMGKRVFIDRHVYKLYPNIYVMIISSKSGLRKGVPIMLANKFMNMLSCTRVVKGQHSIQGIVKELSTQTTLENGLVLSDAQGIIIAPEMASAMVEDSSTWTTLTELHNTHEHDGSWKKTLANSPVQELKNVCISFLAASNEALFEDAVKSKDIEGGFIARTFIVHESRRRGINSLVEKPEGLIPADILIKHLEKLKSISGEFIWEPAGGKYYDHWYKEFCAREIDDRTGTLERLGDQVIKAAMLLSLADLENFDKLILTREIIEEAIDRVEQCFLGTKRIALGQGQSQTAPAVAKVLKVLVEAPNQKITRMKLLKKLWPDIDSMTLEQVIETLKLSGAIVEPRREGNDIVYQMEQERYDEYTKYRQESK